MHKCWNETEHGDYWYEFVGCEGGVHHAYIALIERDSLTGENWFASVTCGANTDIPVFCTFASTLEQAEYLTLGFIHDELGL